MMNIEQSPNYGKNINRGNGGKHGPCIICGKPVNSPKAKLVHVHEGGAVVVTEEEAATMRPAADMGAQPIGSDCLRKHPEYQPYIQERAA